MNNSSVINLQRVKEAEDAITRQQQEVKYDTKAYTIEYLVDKYSRRLEEDKNKLYVPDYQRDFVWDRVKQSKFIESIMLGLPIASIFVAQMPDGRLEIVDGSQRIRTLENFVSNRLELIKLEKLRELEGFRFNDLHKFRQNKFLDIAIDVIVLADTTTQDVKDDMFERINSFEELKDMELRRGIYRGAFNKFIRECGQQLIRDEYKDICPIGEFFKHRKEEEELALRFFALSETFNQNFSYELSFENKKYGKRLSKDGMGMKRFLDFYYLDQNLRLKQMDDEKLEIHLEKMRERFLTMLNFVSKNFPYGFARNQKAEYTSRIFFEAISVGVDLALREKPSLSVRNVDWLKTDKDFIKAMTGKYGLSKSQRIKTRIEIVRDNLLNKK